MTKDEMKEYAGMDRDVTAARASKGVEGAMKACAMRGGLASYDQEVLDWLGRCEEPTPTERIASIRISASLLAQRIVRDVPPGARRTRALAYLRDAVRNVAHQISEEL